jgi:hypothetical protein|tara:strand:+ start:982 stop:1155 length:174 start_codon:yes stop_codon:yes gene_type:complete
MNSKETVYYMLGTIGDVTRDEAVNALKNYTDLNESEINQIIDEIIEFNKQFKKKLTS